MWRSENHLWRCFSSNCMASGDWAQVARLAVSASSSCLTGPIIILCTGVMCDLVICRANRTTFQSSFSPSMVKIWGLNSGCQSYSVKALTHWATPLNCLINPRWAGEMAHNHLHFRYKRSDPLFCGYQEACKWYTIHMQTLKYTRKIKNPKQYSSLNNEIFLQIPRQRLDLLPTTLWEVDLEGS